ncbi:hypothetical protein CC86DRAFT_379829 [Ophiobolus disseminans]|uniref:Uncharacterized protein n=1 Tax=Ophiobolus disseminans TaxID=1469910 RepID=A0A6A7A8K3_9PLEO|nr:hypothetical protein CC86DRAFT_379829 [Ophiobolus disseminans]
MASANLQHIRSAMDAFEVDLKHSSSVRRLNNIVYDGVLQQVCGAIHRVAHANTEDEARIVFEGMRGYVNDRERQLFGLNFAANPIHINVNNSTWGTTGLVRFNNNPPPASAPSRASSATASSATVAAPSSRTAAPDTIDASSQTMSPESPHAAGAALWLHQTLPANYKGSDITLPGDILFMKTSIEYEGEDPSGLREEWAKHAHWSGRRPGHQHYGPTPHPMNAADHPASRHLPPRGTEGDNRSGEEGVRDEGEGDEEEGEDEETTRDTQGKGKEMDKGN